MCVLERVERILDNPDYTYNHNNLLNILDELKRKYRFENDDEVELAQLKKEIQPLDYYNPFTHEVDWSTKHSFLRAAQRVYRILSRYDWR